MHRSSISEGNRYLREKHLYDRQEAHRERLRKIKHRRHGTSKTLDNLPPIVRHSGVGERRKSDRKIQNYVTELKNKSLLKRISNILTAPSKMKSNEEHYLVMKKLYKRNGRNDFSEMIIAKHNKQFFTRLKTMSSNYRPEEWEKDYIRQVLTDSLEFFLAHLVDCNDQKWSQKFMRQVFYERPEGFVDSFSNPPRMDTSISSSPTCSTAASHISRVRNIKSQHNMHANETTNSNSKASNSTSSSYSKLVVKTSSHNGSLSAKKNDGDYEDDKFEDEEYGNDEFDTEGEDGQTNENNTLMSLEQKVELVNIVRKMVVPINNTVSSNPDTQTAAGTPSVTGTISGWSSVCSGLTDDVETSVLVEHLSIDVQIRCWLVNSRDLVIEALSCEGQAAFIEAEAELPIADLGVVRSEVTQNESNEENTGEEQKLSAVGAELKFLDECETVAKLIAETVELRIDDNIPRLLLNLMNDEDENNDSVLNKSEEQPIETSDGINNRDKPTHVRDNHNQNTIDNRSDDIDSALKSSEKEIEADYYTDETFEELDGQESNNEKDIIVNIISLSTGRTESVKNRNSTSSSRLTETIPAKIHVSCKGEEKAEVTVQILSDSIHLINPHAKKTQYSSGGYALSFSSAAKAFPAVKSQQIFRTHVGLPSLMQADPQLLSVFMENLVNGLSIEVNGITGDSNIILSV